MEQNSENMESGILSKIIGVGFFLFCVFAIARYYFGNKVIGSWFEKPGEYTTQYWIYLEPDRKSTKNYRVKGDIEKISLGEEGWGYYLRTVYWNNGGNVDFYESDCQLTIVKGDYCVDDSGNSYKVRLGEKVQ